jgi:hypothetical protein
MRLPYYIILHPEADLSEVEKGRLINGLIVTLESETRDGLEADDLNNSIEPQQ